MYLSLQTDHTHQMMYLQESKDIIIKMEVLGGKTSHHITVTERKMNKAKDPPGHHGQEGFVRLWDLCINIDTNTGFQFDGDVVIPEGDWFDPASHQRFVKFGEVGSLLCDII